jgi:cytochrome P450
MESLAKRFLNFWLHADFIYERTAQYKQHRQACVVLKKYCRSVLDQVPTTVEDAPKTFVNQLLGISKSVEKLTDNEIMSEMLTTVFAVGITLTKSS